MCYIKYRDPSSVGVAQHLTNTVFVDRALIVVPCAEGECSLPRFKKKRMKMSDSVSVDFMAVFPPLNPTVLSFWLITVFIFSFTWKKNWHVVAIG